MALRFIPSMSAIRRFCWKKLFARFRRNHASPVVENGEFLEFVSIYKPRKCEAAGITPIFKHRLKACVVED